MMTTSFPRHADDAAGAFLVPLAKMLAKDVELTVLAPWSSGRLDDEIEGVRVERFRYWPTETELFYGSGAPEKLHRMKRVAVGAMASLVREISRRKADVVFAHWLVPGALAAILTGAHTVAYGHGSDVELVKRVPGLMRLISSRARVLVPSEGMRQEVPGSTVVPLPVDEISTAEPFGKFDVGFMGRLIPRKGLRLLLRAARGRSVLVAGDGPERIDVENATYLGAISPRDRARFFASIRVLAVPSIEPEGSPSVIAEAHAAGVPVVGFAVRGIEGVPVTTPDDVDGLAALIDRMLEDERFRRESLARGRDAVASRSPRALAPTYLHLLQTAARHG